MTDPFNFQAEQRFKASQSAYQKQPDKSILEENIRELCQIRGCGRQTAIEILAAIGRLLINDTSYTQAIPGRNTPKD